MFGFFQAISVGIEKPGKEALVASETTKSLDLFKRNSQKKPADDFEKFETLHCYNNKQNLENNLN